MSLIEQYFLMLIASIIMGTIVYFVISKKKKISLIKLSLLIIFLFMATIISSNITVTALKILFLLAILSILIKFFYSFTFPMSIILAVMVYFLYILGEVISSIIMIDSFGFNYQDIIQSFTLSLYCHGIVFLVTILLITVINVIRQFIQKRKFNKIKKFRLTKINFRIVLFVYLIITILLIGIFGQLYMLVCSYEKNQVVTLIASVIIVCFFISLIVIYLYRAVLKERFQYEEKEKEYNQLVIYTEVVEGLIKDLRNYKHNYVNTLASIKGYLEQGDYESLKDYFNNEIMKDMNRVIKGQDVYSPLQKIINPGVKGLVATKVNNAINNQIQFHVDILENVDFYSYKIETIDICKILGILLDNAIEAAMESKKKNASLLITSNEESISVVVTNTFKDTPAIDKIFNYGYSTKGKSRGIGLSIVKDIIDTKYQNILFNTIIENDTFIIELIICKS